MSEDIKKSKPELNLEEFTVASIDEIQDKFGVLKTGRREIIPIDLVNKKAIILTVKDLTVSESLGLLERISTVNEDTGLPMILFRDYYEICWNRLVIKSEPNLEWKDVKRYNQQFLEILMKRMPSLKALLAVEIEDKDKKKSRPL